MGESDGECSRAETAPEKEKTEDKVLASEKNRSSPFFATGGTMDNLVTDSIFCSDSRMEDEIISTLYVYSVKYKAIA